MDNHRFDLLNSKIDNMSNKIDRLSDKVENHLERLSVAEESIVWLKGHVKIVTALGITVIAGVITILMKGLN